MFVTGECAIPYINQEVILWYVKGIPGVYYPTKIVAEASARISFPNEDPDRRYSRIFYQTFTPQP